MSLPEINYRRNGHTSFDFWSDDRSIWTAVIFDTNVGTYAGLVNRDAWKCVMWETPGFKEGVVTKGLLHFMSMKILKEGWFALSQVEFVCRDGRRFTGKTDKQLAKFLTKFVPLHE